MNSLARKMLRGRRKKRAMVMVMAPMVITVVGMLAMMSGEMGRMSTC